MIGNGVFEDETDEGKIGFCFGPLAGYFTEKESGKNILDLLKEQAKGFETPYLQYFYGAHVAYCKINKIEKEIDIVEVGRLMAKLGAKRCAEIYSASLDGLLIKNGKAPEPTGQEQGA